MNINVITAIKNLDGSTAMNGDAEVTARRILIDSLMFQHEDDARMSGKDKIRIVKLALKIDGEDAPEFTTEDIAFLVARVDKMCPPLTVYRIREILDPASLNG